MAKGAPKGSHYALGNKGGGRKGYQYEKGQLLAMRNIVTYFLGLLNKVMKGTATERQIASFSRVYPAVSKVMDKLHANKQHLEGELNANLQYHFIINGNGSNNNIPDKSVPPATPSV